MSSRKEETSINSARSRNSERIGISGRLGGARDAFSKYLTALKQEPPQPKIQANKIVLKLSTQGDQNAGDVSGLMKRDSKDGLSKYGSYRHIYR